jgi:hypothetical protein
MRFDNFSFCSLQIDCIKFVDDATGCGISISIYQKDDAMVLIDLQLAERPAMVVSLPRDIPGALQIPWFERFLRKHPTVCHPSPAAPILGN